MFLISATFCDPCSATCIKGHRSTTCNHGERPLHEIKKKGRPSTQCLHCKELRKAKQVNVRCICGKEGDNYSCGCMDGSVCTCCRDRTGHVVAKPGKSSSKHAVFKNNQSRHQHGVTSLDFDKAGLLFDHQDMLSLTSQHTLGIPSIHSPDGSISSNSSFGLDSTFNGMGISVSGTSSQVTQSLNTGSSGRDHPPSISSPLANQQNQMQSQLCFDYASSSDYDSDHYNPPTSSYSYFPHTMTSYPVSNASDDLGEGDLNMLQDVNGQRPTLIGSLSSEEVGSFYTTLSNFNTSTSQAPVQSTQTTVSSVPTNSRSCCKTTNNIPSPIPSTFSQSPSIGRSDDHVETETNGCGCAISPNMCCCGELCACPGCLSFPNNQTSTSTGYPGEIMLGSGGSSNDSSNFNNAVSLRIDSQTSATESSGQKGSCCGSNKPITVVSNNTSDMTGNGIQALNLSQALSLIGASSQNASNMIDGDVQQALRQSLSILGQSGMEPVKLQHPTLLADNGVLICGCGCGRPTVDCADCFRDMCEFVGESQARVLKEEHDFEMAMNRDGGYLTDMGLNMNMSMAMNMNLGMALDTNMDVNMDMSSNETGSMELLPSQGSNDVSSIYTQIQQQQEKLQEPPKERHEQQQQQQQQKQQQQQSSLSPPNQAQHQDQLLSQQEEHKLRLQLMEQEQMQLSQLQPSALNQFQLDFLDDEDWSFVDEIRTDSLDEKRP
ncbi:hypothetical protein BGZ46_001246 [Entomortierella lignicola]|nr:hypothetical protein BGZ46_001246 [Entomortierella lignicola]